jgi:hypothetical protein
MVEAPTKASSSATARPISAAPFVCPVGLASSAAKMSFFGRERHGLLRT